MQQIYCWGGSVSGWFGGWMVRNDHSNCVFGTKFFTIDAQNYLLITEFMIKRTLISGCD